MQIYSSALFRYAYEGKKAKYLIAIIVEWNKKKLKGILIYLVQPKHLIVMVSKRFRFVHCPSNIHNPFTNQPFSFKKLSKHSKFHNTCDIPAGNAPEKIFQYV